MNAETLQPGTPVKIKVNKALVDAQYAGPTDNPSYGVFIHSGKSFTRAFNRIVLARTSVQPELPTVEIVESATAEVPIIDVNTKFVHIEMMVDMIVRDVERSLVVTGSGGLGKSHTVFNRLKLNDLGPADVVEVKGHCSPKAMYRTLHDNNGSIVVFDDCDSVVNNESSANILKGALDGSGRRIVSWRSERESSGLPDSFEYTGRVIFISNMTLQEFPQPLVSRALYVDVTMTPAEKINRIKAIGPQLCPDSPLAMIDECIDLIDVLRDKVSDLNFRTLTKVVNIRKANPTIWRDMASLMITSRLNRSGR